MKNTDGRGLCALAIALLLIVIFGAIMLWLNQQPRVTPASATGSMQEQLSPQTNPKH